MEGINMIAFIAGFLITLAGLTGFMVLLGACSLLAPAERKQTARTARSGADLMAGSKVSRP